MNWSIQRAAPNIASNWNGRLVCTSDDDANRVRFCNEPEDADKSILCRQTWIDMRQTQDTIANEMWNFIRTDIPLYHTAFRIRFFFCGKNILHTFPYFSTSTMVKSSHHRLAPLLPYWLCPTRLTPTQLATPCSHHKSCYDTNGKVNRKKNENILLSYFTIIEFNLNAARNLARVCINKRNGKLQTFVSIKFL